MTQPKLVPFGKYRGQPIEVLENDPSYVDWLLQQDWAQKRYPQFVQVIVNNFGGQQESPEHNQMQARFLEQEWRKKFAASVKPELFRPIDLQEFVRSFWVSVTRGGIITEAVSFRPMPELIPMISFDEMPKFEYGKTSIDVCISFSAIGKDSTPKCDYFLGLIESSRLISVEIKPIIDETYPATLRQIKANGAKNLLYREFTANSVTENTFRLYFESQGIRVRSEAEIENTEIPPIAMLDTRAFINLLKTKIEVIYGGT